VGSNDAFDRTTVCLISLFRCFITHRGTPLSALNLTKLNDEHEEHKALKRVKSDAGISNLHFKVLGDLRKQTSSPKPDEEGLNRMDGNGKV